MQKISKKMSHKEAKEYREISQDAVMYQHRNGRIYLLRSLTDPWHEGDLEEPEYVTHDVNELLIG